MIKNKNGYALIIVTCVIGFLLVFTGAVLKLALTELNDSKGRYDYLKAYYGAKGTMEYALLEIKTYGYGYCNNDYENLDNIMCILERPDGTSCPDDEIFGKNVKAGFEVDTCTDKMDFNESKLTGYGFDMIPLYIVSTGSSSERGKYKPITGVEELTSRGISDDKDFSWNFIGEKGGLSGIGDIGGTNGKNPGDENIFTYREVYESGDKKGTFNYSKESINGLVKKGSGAFLLIRNGTPSSDVTYRLETEGSFSKPKSTITASAKVGDYMQTMKYTYDFSGRNSILSNAIYDAN